ncbi:MAG: carbon-nitrogen hydrolase family protein [Boseongicola sp.]
MRVGLIQLNSSDDPISNISSTCELVQNAAAQGAEFILTPEVTNCVSASRTRQAEVLVAEGDDQTLASLRAEAKRNGVWILIGSLALSDPSGDGRSVNRSFLISPSGNIDARYDKMHMFDVTISESESYRESAGYRPGSSAVLAEVAGVAVGLTVCYDLRFPYLYRSLAQAGAQIITIPSAFAPETGAAHWEVLLRARAIETGSFVLAPAQCGNHSATRGKSRQTYGHSMAVDPWGAILVDGGEFPGATLVDLDLKAVDDARRRIPSLTHDRMYRPD